MALGKKLHGPVTTQSGHGPVTTQSGLVPMSIARAIAAVALVVAVLTTPLGADDGESGFDPVQMYPDMPRDYVPDVFATAETNHLRYYQVGLCAQQRNGARPTAVHRQTYACLVCSRLT